MSGNHSFLIVLPAGAFVNRLNFRISKWNLREIPHPSLTLISHPNPPSAAFSLITGETPHPLLIAKVWALKKRQSRRILPSRKSFCYRDLLRNWLNGEPIVEIRKSFGEDAPSPEDSAGFIEDYFGLRLPWLCSAFIRLPTEALGMNSEGLSTQSRFLPSLIKYGIPMVEAAWAMVLGVPSRLYSMQIASAYREEKGVQDMKTF